MVIIRSGIFGSYYGTPFNESSPINSEQMDVNAYYIYRYLTSKGWTLESICGLLGNMQHESGLNPGRWQNDNVGVGPAYGLVQWDYFTKYTNWCAENNLSDPSEMDNNLARILYELENNLQYYETDSYPISFRAFTKSNESPYYLACAFAWNYERSYVVLEGTEAEKEALRIQRGSSATSWFLFLSQQEPPTPPHTPTHKMPLWMYLRYK